MNLLKSKLSVAIALGILGGTTQAFACSVTPDSILTEGQTLQLVADCTGVDGTVKVKEINWQMAVGTGDAVSITGNVALNQPKAKLIYLTTPIGLTSAGTGEYTFSVTGTYSDGTPITTTDAQSAKVVVKPASVAVALALGTNSVTPVNASCGSADGTVVSSMPSGAAQCTSGKGALAISGPGYFTWTCLSQTGGAEDNCYATRTGYVAPTTTTTTTPTTTTTTTTTSSASTDPGTGSWIPPNTTGRLIAGQSGPTAAYLSSYVPGCLNGSYITSSWNTGCGANSSYTGALSGTSTTTTFSFGAGRVLGLRYMSKATAGTALRYFTMGSADGGNTGSMSVWLSDSPTATYAETANACKSTSTTQPYVLTGPGYCPIVANKGYYLFMSTTRTESGLRYLVNEGGADFY
ncbi:MAG: hypothetical protein K0M58_09595 [Thiobacillus sp.]|nr:hypothetical protein [Thiobacillus sp.]